MNTKTTLALAGLTLMILAGPALGLAVVEKTPTGFSAQGYAIITDSSGTTGPLEQNKWDPNDVHIAGWSELTLSTSYSNASASAGASFSSFEHSPGVIMVDFFLDGSAQCDTTSSTPNIVAYGNASTLTPGTTNGYFFQIVPTAPGEQLGDAVTVAFDFSVSANVYGSGGSARVSGTGSMDHLALTLNETPPVWPDAPDPANEIWQTPNVAFNETTYLNESSVFNARIGDVLGIFAFVESRAELTAPGNVYVGCYPCIYLTVELVKNPMDFNNDGYVNLVDFAIFAQEWLWIRPGRDE